MIVIDLGLFVFQGQLGLYKRSFCLVVPVIKY